jgi:hypothetical protein
MERQSMSNVDPTPDWYLRRAAFLALQGVTITLPPDDEGASNVHSIELARTNRAIAQMRRGRFASGPTDPAV